MKRLWLHDDGRCCCDEHIGSEAAGTLKRNPDARKLRTCLGTWEKALLVDRVEWVRLTGRQLDCEICEATGGRR